MHPDLPIIGIEPALKPAISITQTGRIGVMATRGTLGSEKFKNLYASLKDQAEFILQPCDGLADAIERDDTIKIRLLCQQYLNELGTFGAETGQTDTLVLGCTHYPFIQPILQDLAGHPLHFLEGGVPVARQTRRVLDERFKLFVGTLASSGQPSKLQFFSTGIASTLFETVKRWMHFEQAVHSIKIT